MASSEVLLFDLGGVVVDFRGGEGAHAVAKGAYSLDYWRANWWRLPELDRLERGEIAPLDFADAFIARWGLDIERADFVEAFKHWVVGVFDGVPALLSALRQRHRLACLSNVNPAHWERCIELGVPALFDKRYLSHEMGLRKPEPEIYRAVAADLGVSPASIHFFDDVPANVEAAIAAGMRATLVGDGEIRSALAATGLI